MDTRVSLMRSRQEILLLVPLPPHDPQPARMSGACRSTLPLFEAAEAVHHDAGGVGVLRQFHDIGVVVGVDATAVPLPDTPEYSG